MRRWIESESTTSLRSICAALPVRRAERRMAGVGGCGGELSRDMIARDCRGQGSEGDASGITAATLCLEAMVPIFWLRQPDFNVDLGLDRNLNAAKSHWHGRPRRQTRKGR